MFIFRATALLTMFLLAACNSYQAPVEEAGGAPRFLDAGRTHRVNGGETLYAVAWMYDLDFGALARANNLREPYTIEPGQMLTVDLRGIPATAPGNTGSVAVTTPVTTGVAVQRAPISTAPLTRQSLPGTTLPNTTPPAPAPDARPSRLPGTIVPPPANNPPVSTPPVSTPPVSTPPVSTPPPVVATAPTPPPAPVPAAPVIDPNAPVAWAWPTSGNLLASYSETAMDNKGIDIDGKRGDPILAAADGEVVYAGGGLLRYGDLVILKHNERFLSAYAHNSVISVKEGDRVTRGQKIAELGSSGIDRNMLHFEIRLDGKPVDPQLYLPSR